MRLGRAGRGAGLDAAHELRVAGEDATICRYLSQPHRLELWGREIPRGMRLGWTCNVAYCGNPEHFILTECRNVGWRSYKEIRERLCQLKDGEWFDLLDEPNDEKSVTKFTCGLRGGKTPHFLVRRLKRSSGVRIIRYGTFYQPITEFLKAHPVLRTGACRINGGLEVGAFYLGLLWGTSDTNHGPRKERCAIRGCAFPSHRSGSLCSMHIHYFDVESCAGVVDLNDMFGDENGNASLFTTGMLWEDKYNWKNLRFSRAGRFETKHEQMSRQWWEKNVEAEASGAREKRLPKNKKKVRKAQRIQRTMVDYDDFETFTIPEHFSWEEQ